MHTGGRVKEGWGIEYVIFIYVVNTSYNYETTGLQAGAQVPPL